MLTEREPTKIKRPINHVTALNVVLRAARKAKRRRLPLVATLTTISRDNAPHLVHIYEAFRDKVDLFVYYLSWWIDDENAVAHERDFSRRFGFAPELHRGWIGDWTPTDYRLLHQQLQEVLDRSQARGAPPVTVIPPITDREGLETYYSDHSATFGFDQCTSIYQAVEINSNGDMSPCRDYHDYIVGNIKQSFCL